MNRHWMLSGAMVLGFATAASAQTAPADPARTAAPPAQAATGSACLDELARLAEQIDRDGYISGYPGVAGTPAAVEPRPVPAGPATAGSPTAPPVRPGAPATTMQGPMTERWSASPTLAIRTLYGAAAILGERGDEAGCEMIRSKLTEIYSEHTTRLREAGVQPGRVTAWRAEQIAAARPVSEVGTLRMDRITGATVRNPADESLGSIDDLVLDPGSGSIAYAIVSHGGFLGFGGRDVAVPWNALKVTPGMSSFVLDATPEQMERAPEVDAEALGDRVTFDQRRPEIDGFWQESRGG